MGALDPFEEGFLLGILVGEGPSAAMAGRHRSPCACTSVMRSSSDGSWRSCQAPACTGRIITAAATNHWMARGKVLRESLLPALLRRLPVLDDHVRGRVEDMIRDYGLSA